MSPSSSPPTYGPCSQEWIQITHQGAQRPGQWSHPSLFNVPGITGCVDHNDPMIKGPLLPPSTSSVPVHTEKKLGHCPDRCGSSGRPLGICKTQTQRRPSTGGAMGTDWPRTSVPTDSLGAARHPGSRHLLVQTQIWNSGMAVQGQPLCGLPAVYPTHGLLSFCGLPHPWASQSQTSCVWPSFRKAEELVLVPHRHTQRHTHTYHTAECNSDAVVCAPCTQGHS